MKIVDANVLLYAVNEDVLHHKAARSWLDDSLSGGATVGFAWISILAFVRLSTKPELFPQALPLASALGIVESWLLGKTAVVVEPTSLHFHVMSRLLSAVGSSGGNLVNDAHLAALAIEHRGAIVSFDGDFARFPGVLSENPASERPASERPAN